MSLHTSISEFFKILNDKRWHSLYELHQKYRLSPIEIHKAISVLENLGLIEFEEDQIRLSTNLTESKLSIMNRLSKTKRPKKLNEYRPGLD